MNVAISTLTNVERSLRQMRNVAISLKLFDFESSNEERSYHFDSTYAITLNVRGNEERSLSPSSLRQMRNVAINLKSSTNEERSYHPQVFDK